MSTTTKRSRARAPVQAPSGNGAHPLPLNIEINIDAMTWEDMRILMTAQGQELNEALVLDVHGLFERIVIGGAKAVPVMRTMEVLTAIGEAMKGLGNPKA